MSKRCEYLAKQPDDPMHMSYRQLVDIYSEKVEVFPQRRSRSSEVFKHIAKGIPTKTGLKLCDTTWPCHSWNGFYKINLFSYPGCQTFLYNNFGLRETSWKWWGPIWLHVCPVPKNTQHHASATARRSHHIHQRNLGPSRPVGWHRWLFHGTPLIWCPYVGKFWWWSSSRLLPWKDEWCTGSSTRTYYLGFRS